MRDSIVIEQLEITAHLGVPEEERAQPQRLTASLRLVPQNDFRDLQDRLANSVDYALVCRTVARVAGAKPRRLLETLAEEIAERLLAEFSLARVEVDLRKFILKETNFVAVKITRDA